MKEQKITYKSERGITITVEWVDQYQVKIGVPSLPDWPEFIVKMHLYDVPGKKDRYFPGRVVPCTKAAEKAIMAARPVIEEKPLSPRAQREILVGDVERGRKADEASVRRAYENGNSPNPYADADHHAAALKILADFDAINPETKNEMESDLAAARNKKRNEPVPNDGWGW